MLFRSSSGDGGGRMPAVLTLVVTLATVAVSWSPYIPRDTVPATAPETDFSAQRARAHLERIAQRPRPPGSAAHQEVQDYLTGHLRGLGLESDVQTTTVVADRWGVLSVAGTVSNIAVRLRGSGEGRAVLLVAHYDGVAGGPGANDNGVAVAALLETLRALQAGPQLRNDVIVLFTDAEESGLLGARAFARGHPWAQDVRLVFNFEARGTYGPSVMFETSSGNGWLVEELSEAVATPMASSLFDEVYRRLPNDTDFTIFRQAGYPGMNFAYIGGVTAYHTRLDDIGAVDPHSLQQHGSYALSLTRRFGERDLEEASSHDAVFFNVPVLGLISYDERWSAPLAVTIFLVLLGVIVWGIRNGRLRPGRTAVAMAAFVGMLLVVPALVAGLWWLVATTHAAYQWMPLGATYNDSFYVTAFLLLTVALTTLTHRWLRRRLALRELFTGALMTWAIMMLASGLSFPGGSYLWTWPTLFATAALIYLLRSEEEVSGTDLLIVGSGSIPAILLMAPIVYLVYLATTVQMSGLLMLPVVLVLGLLLPYLELLQRAGRSLLVITPALAALILLVSAGLSSGFDEDHPRPDSLFYVMDEDRSRAWWVSSDRRTDTWTSHYLGGDPARAPMSDQFPAIGYPFLQARAPVLASLEPPLLELISQELQEDGRVLRVRIRSRRGADQLWVNVAPGMEIAAATVNGEELARRPDAGRPWSLHYVGLPSQGVELSLTVKGLEPVRIQAVDRTGGLPDAPMVERHPRPPNTMPTLMFDAFQDATFVAAGRLVEPPGQL